MSSSSGPRLALFDCDGTLVDSLHGIHACMVAAFATEGLPAPSAVAVKRVIGLPLGECVTRLAPGESAARQASLTEAYKAVFFELRQRPDFHEPMFDGTLAALDALEAAGFLLGIATGKGRRGLDAVLERHRLIGRFATLQTSDAGPGKPHPAMVERALAETGVAAVCASMIGDSVYDMQMARTAGIHAVGVAWGYHTQAELVASGAHVTVDRFADLHGVLSNRTGRAPCG